MVGAVNLIVWGDASREAARSAPRGAERAVLEVCGRAHAERSVAALAVVEDLDVVEDLVRSSAFCGHGRRLTSSFLSVAKKLSATALSKQSPRLPIDWAIPAALAVCPNASETYWLP